MAEEWEGESSMLVRVGSVVRLCCHAPATTLLAPLLPLPAQEPLERHATGLLEGGRFTILPTISIVPPWDDTSHLHYNHLPHHHSNQHHHSAIGPIFPHQYNQHPMQGFPHDQNPSDSSAVLRIISPTPVLSPSSITATPTPSRPTWVQDAALNATHRFYNVLRAVLHGGEEQQLQQQQQQEEASSFLRNEAQQRVELPNKNESSNMLSNDLSSVHSLDAAIPPLIQVCLGLAVVVVVMVVLFHWHQIRREWSRERRALRHLIRRYRQDDGDNDLEKNGNSKVTDVTL